MRLHRFLPVEQGTVDLRLLAAAVRTVLHPRERAVFDTGVSLRLLSVCCGRVMEPAHSLGLLVENRHHENSVTIRTGEALGTALTREETLVASWVAVTNVPEQDMEQRVTSSSEEIDEEEDDDNDVVFRRRVAFAQDAAGSDPLETLCVLPRANSCCDE
jgi:hypothetical protein